MLFVCGFKKNSMKVSKCGFCKYRWECKDKNNCKLEKENKENEKNE